MQTYYKVIADAWIYGKHYKAGDYVKLNPKQAKYEILSSTISPVPVSSPKLNMVRPSKPNIKAEEF